MDSELMSELAKMFGDMDSTKTLIGDQDINTLFSNDLNVFMDSLFGRKRILILKVNMNKAKIIKELKEYCERTKIEVSSLDTKNLTVDNIKGECEIFYENGMPYSYRKKPYYVSGANQMILVDNLAEDTDIEVLRAFMYMGSLGCYYDDVENLPKEKLPYGSAYVFIADNNFPIKRFASISSYWNDEAAILDLRDYQTKIKGHLGAYKRNKLKILEDGIFNYQGKELLYEHILPVDKRELNIIEKYRSDFFQSDYSNINFHKYFHHLNSSQAMCINFFYPLIKENLLESILSVINIKGEINYNSKDICFEKGSELETNAKRKTNFDFYIKLTSGIKVYFEIKYSENEFGKAKHDEEHKNKFNDIYMPLIKDNPAIEKSYKTEDIFLDNYQIMRNIAHVSEDSYVIFIYPKENQGIRKTALSARKNIIARGWGAHFILFTWEDLIKELNYRLNSGEVINYYNKEFSYKYF
ncbi:PGN_0703 family putative restriction endonuclease [Clostridium lacusfryxellense]|uniref:PGN_0703 family putative restriction endonuclease n=1 Tax=Clostridium lacusfryxellense TaxID=205328 RepID=UPI001C0E4F58|nr:hypothetical protein [Clostridium lacusfryxellense]MBU3112692.1 hypothetical protein [Clostridium lacusfryxellense]